jgi:hypothetical protein
MKKVLTVLMFFFWILSKPSFALIVDLPDENGLGYFKDTRSGYTWMDLKNTTFTNLTGAQSLLDQQGFIWADEQVLRTMVESAMEGPQLSEFSYIGNDNQTFYYLTDSAYYLNKVMGGETPNYEDTNVAGLFAVDDLHFGFALYRDHYTSLLQPTGWQFSYHPYEYEGASFYDQTWGESLALWAYKPESMGSVHSPEPMTLISMLSGLGLFLRRKRG